MLANKALLSVTLAATFGSGMVVGVAAGRGVGRGAGVPPSDPLVIYAPQLDELAAKGYDAGEMKDARQAYADYFTAYQYQWNQFLDMEEKNLRGIDEKWAKRLEDIERRHAARTGAK